MRTSVALLAAAVALFLVARLAHRAPTPPSSTQPAAREAPRLHPEVPHERDRGPSRLPTPPQATRTARRFVSAYLHWQDGSRDEPTIKALRHAASPRLWDELTSGANLPSARRSVPVQRLRRLVAGAAGTRRAATVLAELDDQQHVGSLALVVRHTEHGWRVTSLTP